MSEPDVRCKSCNWKGKTEELDYIRCPKCGSAEYIEDVNPPREKALWELYEGDYNWNKI